MNYLEFLAFSHEQPARAMIMGGSILMHARCAVPWLGSIRATVFPFYASHISLYLGNQTHTCSVCSKKMHPHDQSQTDPQ